MGYTHYFKTTGEIPQDRWDNEFLPQAKKLVAITIDEGVPIVNAWGERSTEPEFGSDRIFLNGLEEDSHETMEISRTPKDFYFCKTARKPYDGLCVALCILAERLFPDNFSWSSDGEGEHDYMDEGKRLLEILRITADVGTSG